MRRLIPIAFLAGLLTPLCLSRDARAVWPAPASVPRADLERPEYWPNDPGFGPSVDSNGSLRSGEWQLFGWVPALSRALPGFRAEEAGFGAGNNVDNAWQITIGTPRVLIGVLDSGIKWEDDDLQLKAALNTNELPMPEGATSYDANADGVVNVADYFNDTRIPCGTALPHPMRACMGADGMPNDPNRNGKFDAGDLIRIFTDGIDQDHNGYVDDISGWDFFKDDNDPFDDTNYGHGTGEAHDSASEANNGIGVPGVCPRCMFVPLRVGDSFTADSMDYGQAVVYATDARYGTDRILVVQEALGNLNFQRFAAEAQDYAYARGAVIIASAADENSRHHNLPGTSNHTVYVHAVAYNGSNAQNSTTFLSFNNCTNYGGQLQLSVAGNSCSSEAVGQTAGIAGLMYSEAIQTNLDPALSAEEVRQLLLATVDDINIPESQPNHPMYDRNLYPSLPGWDQRFGYGRTNTRRAVESIRDRRIPPEVDIVSPRWFTTYFADRAPYQRLRIEGRIAARRAPRFDYTVEWAAGIEPRDRDFMSIRNETNVTAPVTDMLGEIDLTRVMVNNPGEVENRYTITLRIRATAHYDAPVGDVNGEVRRVVYVHRDPDLLPGFPVETAGSVESSSHLVDLNGDGRREIVIADSDGFIHALQSDGTELPGWPAHTNLELGFDALRTPSYRESAAYSGATPVIDPDRIYEMVIATPAIGDLDGDGTVEIVVASYHGTIYAFNHDGTPYGAPGFPHRLPDVPSSATGRDRLLDRGVFGSPVLADLDRDDRPEIIVGAADGYLYVFNGRTAAAHPGFPVLIHFPEPGVEYGRVFGPVGVGRFDTDNIPDLVVLSNEKIGQDRNAGAAYIVHGDGMNHAGGPFHPNWPIVIPSISLLPMVAEGMSSSPAIADLDGDGLDELSLTGTAFPTILIARSTQPMHSARPNVTTDLNLVTTILSSQRGPFSDSRTNPVSFIPAFGLASFGDMTGDGVPEYVLPGATLALAINMQSGTRRIPFEHLVGAWNARTGQVLPGFPRLVEDYNFFVNPAVADVSGDAYAELLVNTAGYYLHAFDACGREATGFPKFTGQWHISSPAVANLDNDPEHGLEIVSATRSGFIYAWHTRGRSTGSVQWPTFRHDNANTGNYGTALDFGTRHVAGTEPIVCPVLTPDAGVPEDTGADARPADGGQPPTLGGGCGCRTAGGVPRSAAPVTALVLAAMTLARRRRRSQSAA